MARVSKYSKNDMTTGELLALDRLRQLPDDWAIIANRLLIQQNASSREIDFIVIGKRNVFVIEEKNWQGKLKGNQRIWIAANGQHRKSPLDQAHMLAKSFHGYLTSEIENLKEIKEHFVQPLVLLTGTKYPPNISNDPRSNSQIIMLDDVLQELPKLDSQKGHFSLSLFQSSIWECSIGLNNYARIPSIIGPYKLSEELSSNQETKMFSGSHELGEERLLTIHDLSSPHAQDRSFYENEWKALQSMATSAIVPRTYDIFYEENSDLLVMPADHPSGEPIGLMQSPENTSQCIQELNRAKSAFGALSLLHEKKIIHRALTPESIYFQNDTDVNSVQLTKFHAARSTTKTISEILDNLNIEDPYAAPELRLGYGNATPNSDVYSMALIFAERLYNLSITESNLWETQLELPEKSPINDWFDSDITTLIETFFYSVLDRDSSETIDAQTCFDDLEEIITIIKNPTEDSVPVENISDNAQDIPDEGARGYVENRHPNAGKASKGSLPQNDLKDKERNASESLLPSNDPVSSGYNSEEISLEFDDFPPRYNPRHFTEPVGASQNSIGREKYDYAFIEQIHRLATTIDVSPSDISVITKFDKPRLDTLWLEILSSKDTPTWFKVPISGFSIGRADENDLILDDRRISRHHAKIEYIDNAYVIVDTGSKNGLFVNGSKVDASVLQGTSKLLLGDSRIIAHSGISQWYYQEPRRQTFGEPNNDFRQNEEFVLLTCKSKTGDKKAYIIQGNEITLGRSPKNDVVIEETFVSRHHGRITFDHPPVKELQGYYLEDLKSTNGTTSQGQPVKAKLISDESRVIPESTVESPPFIGLSTWETYRLSGSEGGQIQVCVGSFLYFQGPLT